MNTAVFDGTVLKQKYGPMVDRSAVYKNRSDPRFQFIICTKKNAS